MRSDRYRLFCIYFHWRPTVNVYTINQVYCKYASRRRSALGSIYKQLQQIVNTLMQIRHRVYTNSGMTVLRFSLVLVLVLGAVSCKTPHETIKEDRQTEVKDTSTIHAIKNTDDTTTITHKQIDSTTQVITIIRKIREENDQTAQSLHEETQQTNIRHTDTITTAVVNRIMKGIAIVCIGLAVIAAVFIIILIAIVIYLRKKS